jgi:hypothetical protein
MKCIFSQQMITILIHVTERSELLMWSNAADRFVKRQLLLR